MAKSFFKFYKFNNKDSVYCSLYLFGMNFWAFYYRNQFMWFRILGSGLVIKNTLIHRLSFSERNKYRKGVKINKWYLSRVRSN